MDGGVWRLVLAGSSPSRATGCRAQAAYYAAFSPALPLPPPLAALPLLLREFAPGAAAARQRGFGIRASGMRCAPCHAPTTTPLLPAYHPPPPLYLAASGRVGWPGSMTFLLRSYSPCANVACPLGLELLFSARFAAWTPNFKDVRRTPPSLPRILGALRAYDRGTFGMGCCCACSWAKFRGSGTLPTSLREQHVLTRAPCGTFSSCTATLAGRRGTCCLTLCLPQPHMPLHTAPFSFCCLHALQHFPSTMFKNMPCAWRHQINWRPLISRTSCCDFLSLLDICACAFNTCLLPFCKTPYVFVSFYTTSALLHLPSTCGGLMVWCCLEDSGRLSAWRLCAFHITRLWHYYLR